MNNCIKSEILLEKRSSSIPRHLSRIHIKGADGRALFPNISTDILPEYSSVFKCGLKFDKVAKRKRQY